PDQSSAGTQSSAESSSTIPPPLTTLVSSCRPSSSSSGSSVSELPIGKAPPRPVGFSVKSSGSRDMTYSSARATQQSVPRATRGKRCRVPPLAGGGRPVPQVRGDG